MIDAFATQPHYVTHMAPVWQALGERMGTFWTAGLMDYQANVDGIPNRRTRPAAGLPVGGPTLVAGYSDERDIARPAIYLEHGAGQTYGGADPATADHPAYNGTPGHDRAVLFLCPGETVAARWRARYPRARAVAVGCPKLDRLHLRARADPWTRPGSDREPTVAITFHSNNILCAESANAFPHYQAGLPAAIGRMERAGIRVLGHGHPRLWDQTLGPYWARHGVELVPDLAEVMARADVLVGDNTSALPEFASLGRPVVWMNAPQYRRHVHHGGRFWEWPEGQISVDGPDELPDAVAEALTDPEPVAAARKRMVDSIYVACDGQATARAVAAIAAVDPAGTMSAGPAGPAYA